MQALLYFEHDLANGSIEDRPGGRHLVRPLSMATASLNQTTGGPDVFVRPFVRAAAFDKGERVEYTLVTSGEPARTEAFIRTKR